MTDPVVRPAMKARQVLDREMGSEGERFLETRLRQNGIPFIREFVFASPRNWRADFLILAIGHFRDGRDLLVEVDGGAWSTSRHRTGDGFTKDCEKQSAAAIAGYRVIRCTTEQVKSDECLGWIQAALR